MFVITQFSRVLGIFLMGFSVVLNRDPENVVQDIMHHVIRSGSSFHPVTAVKRGSE